MQRTSVPVEKVRERSEYWLSLSCDVIKTFRLRKNGFFPPCPLSLPLILGQASSHSSTRLFRSLRRRRGKLPSCHRRRRPSVVESCCEKSRASNRWIITGLNDTLTKRKKRAARPKNKRPRGRNFSLKLRFLSFSPDKSFCSFQYTLILPLDLIISLSPRFFIFISRTF